MSTHKHSVTVNTRTYTTTPATVPDPVIPPPPDLSAYALQATLEALATRVAALEAPVVVPPPPPPVIVPPPGPIVPDGLASGAITLQQAVNAAPAGAVMGVPARTFAETVTVPRAMSLIAVGGVPVIDGGMSRAYGLVYGADSITIDGLRVTNCRTPVQDGAIRIIGRRNAILRHVRSDHNGANLVAKDGGAGITTQGAIDFLAEDCEFDGNAQQGYHGSAANQRITYRRCRIHNNNLKGLTDGFWEAGAGKITHSDTVLFEDCDVWDNVGVGLWSDIGANNWTVRRCRIHGNTLSGVMFEISTGAVVEDNALWHNGEKDGRGWGWPAQILISSSTGPVECRRNTMAYSLKGISAITQNRGDKPVGSGSNIHLTDNVAVLTGGAVSGWYDDWSGGFPGKIDTGGVYYASHTAAADAALAAAGIPLA
jgi:hypothetical protein